MQDNPITDETDSENDGPYIDEEGWQIALQPYEGNPQSALTLGFRLIELKQSIRDLDMHEALAEIDRNKIDIIVSDISMPVRDGYELIRQVRSRNMNMPAVALTAFTRVADRDKALSAGFQEHVQKPVDTLKLLATVERLVGKPVHTSA